jgi:hypothetical protein
MARSAAEGDTSVWKHARFQSLASDTLVVGMGREALPPSARLPHCCRCPRHSRPSSGPLSPLTRFVASLAPTKLRTETWCAEGTARFARQSGQAPLISVEFPFWIPYAPIHGRASVACPQHPRAPSLPLPLPLHGGQFASCACSFSPIFSIRHFAAISGAAWSPWHGVRTGSSQPATRQPSSGDGSIGFLNVEA